MIKASKKKRKKKKQNKTFLESNQTARKKIGKDSLSLADVKIPEKIMGNYDFSLKPEAH